MTRRTPPLKALKAFEAAARQGTLAAAAEELCVTASAGGHQIKGPGDRDDWRAIHVRVGDAGDEIRRAR